MFSLFQITIHSHNRPDMTFVVYLALNFNQSINQHQ